MTGPLLLDTCVLIFIARDIALTKEAEAELTAASEARRLFVSVLSAWEMGLAVSKNRLALAAPPLAIFESFLASSGALICDLDASSMVNASALPGRIHRDPIDRMLVSIARSKGCTLVTSDRAILAYGALGHVNTLNCLN